jgi:uncharacterized protein (TIGR02466 family)|tara:strand:+ start:300 stop:839 length:540 start_codon:yes stop_codon:yes gene_type:complete
MNYLDIFKQTIFYTQLELDLKRLEKNLIKTNKNYLSNLGGDQFQVTCKDNNFNAIIEEYANDYCKLLDCQKVKLAAMWLNINRKGNSNTVHDHPESVLSGVFYIKVPKDSGDLVFTNDALLRFFPLRVNNYNSNNSQVWKFIPQEGMLYLFPSWLKHEVTPNNSNKERISIAFNFGDFK